VLVRNLHTGLQALEHQQNCIVAAADLGVKRWKKRKRQLCDDNPAEHGRKIFVAGLDSPRLAV